MSIQSRISRPARVAALSLSLSLLAFCAPNVAKAQSALGALGGFFTLGGYYPTSASGASGLGTPKFFDEGAYYVRPRAVGSVQFAAGLETVDARDHFLPFSGGNEFTLIGLSASISPKHKRNSAFPYLSAGYFYAHLHSDNISVDTTSLIPSMSLGVVVPIYRSIKLSANYRISPDIGGVNTNGFGISLRLF